MKKIIFNLFILFALSMALVAANGDHQTEIEEGKKLVESKIGCSKLNDGQLEAIGEYYMEQMHPGESHEMMDKMMGGEDSESLRQVHITMAKRLYCNEDIGGMMGGGMMGMMPMMMNMMGGGMMGGGMMGGQNVQGSMMGSWGYGFGYWNIINILSAILLIGLIVLVYLWIIKLWRNMKNKDGKK